MSQNRKNTIIELVERVRQQNPLVHSITNYVTANDCANVLLALGASPIMADECKEVTDITSIANALVLNMGTFSKEALSAMLMAGHCANDRNIPVILDPVGAGASSFRREALHTILDEIHFTIIRGNLSEIACIAGYNVRERGVDAAVENQSMDGRKVAEQVAKTYHCITAITGAVDVITDGATCLTCNNGTAMLSRITGTGCMTTALIGAYAAVTDHYLEAASAGILTMGIAGEQAFRKFGSFGTGSFRIGLMDAISKFDTNTMKELAKIYE